ncbi:hypothetical protein EC957_000999 [Mortierella hygrophila]|uniref:Uncharacterized protein n=1 Tax=Mortierella hygrophila TaxID=979708 RepID=A0A9P6F5A0_9FUNG|nr:hypothetical protein EC957_000999 [Mortierella hygrophila]
MTITSNVKRPSGTNNNDSNKRQRNVDGSGSGRGVNRRAAASSSSSNSNNDNNDNNNNNSVRGTHVVDHPITVTSDEEDEVDEEGFVKEELENSRGQRQITGFWAKPDVQQFLVWLFYIENARRITKPGTTAGTKLADVQREVASIINAAMDELPPSSTRWTSQTVKDKFRYIKDQYDKCAKLMNSTGNGDTETSTLTEAVNDITPYYDELLMIFGSQLTRNHPPLRDSAAPSKATFIMDKPDLEERAPGSVSLSSSRSRANPQSKHPFYASLESVVSEFTKQNSSGSSADAGPTLTGQSQTGKEMTFRVELLKREREHVERERLALEQEKQDWTKRMERERDEWTATMEREREDTKNSINRQHNLIDEMREEMKQAKLDFHTEKVRLQVDVVEFRARNKDRETLLTTLAKYKVLVDGRGGSSSPKEPKEFKLPKSPKGDNSFNI